MKVNIRAGFQANSEIYERMRSAERLDSSAGFSSSRLIYMGDILYCRIGCDNEGRNYTQIGLSKNSTPESRNLSVRFFGCYPLSNDEDCLGALKWSEIVALIQHMTEEIKTLSLKCQVNQGKKYKYKYGN